MERAPLGKCGEEVQNGDAHRDGHPVFDMLYLPAQISPGDYPLVLHLAQALDQHLFCCLRDSPANLAQPNRAIHQQQQNLNFPFSTEQIQPPLGGRLSRGWIPA